jgi:hypothetical protein
MSNSSLVPTLKPGDVVILDNLDSHKGKAVRRTIRNVGARLVFLPKYSPDLNPIEQVFAKFKTLRRKAGARSYQAISDACGKILAQCPPAECATGTQTYFRVDQFSGGGSGTEADLEHHLRLTDISNKRTAKNAKTALYWLPPMRRIAAASKIPNMQ